MNPTTIVDELLEATPEDEQLRRIAMSAFPHRRLTQEISAAYKKSRHLFRDFKILAMVRDPEAERWYKNDPQRYGVALRIKFQVAVTPLFKKRVYSLAANQPWPIDRSVDIVTTALLMKPIKDVVAASDEGVDSFGAYDMKSDDTKTVYTINKSFVDKYNTHRWRALNRLPPLKEDDDDEQLRRLAHSGIPHLALIHDISKFLASLGFDQIAARFFKYRFFDRVTVEMRSPDHDAPARGLNYTERRYKMRAEIEKLVGDWLLVHHPKYHVDHVGQSQWYQPLAGPHIHADLPIKLFLDTGEKML